MLEAANSAVTLLSNPPSLLTAFELDFQLSPFDLKRLEAYAANQLDYHVVLDLLPTLGALYFESRLGADVRLSAVQGAILLGMGLQRKSVEEVESELQLPVSQTLALFVKLIRKITNRLQELKKEAIAAEIPDKTTAPALPAVEKPKEGASKAIEMELDQAGNAATSALREKQRAMLDALDLSK